MARRVGGAHHLPARVARDFALAQPVVVLPTQQSQQWRVEKPASQLTVAERFASSASMRQRSSTLKPRDFCPVRPVKTFDKGILRWLVRLNKRQQYTMFFCPLCQRQGDQC